MLKFLILVAVLFAVAFGFHWLKATSGEVALTIGDTVYAVDLTTAAIGLVAVGRRRPRARADRAARSCARRSALRSAGAGATSSAAGTPSARG